MKTKMAAFMLLAMLLALSVSPVYADEAPSLPHAFYGTVEINGSPAPTGTEVEVRGEGVRTGVTQNPLVTTAQGEYGGSGSFDLKLLVWGDIADGATVTFYVNGFSTGQTATWHSGEVTEVDLAATIEEGAVPEEPPDTGDSTPPGTGDSTPPDTGDSTPPDTGDSTSPDTGDSTPPDTTGSTPPDAGDSTSPGSTGPGSEGDSSGSLLPPSAPSDGVGGVPVLWLVIGGVVLVGLIIAFAVARSRAY
jgi:hypothetical protein